MNGGSQSGRSCCGTDKEPCNQLGSSCVDTLLLVLHVQEVQNFELWEQARVAEEVPVQDWVVKEEWDCFRELIAK